MVSQYVNPVLLPLLLLGVIVAFWSYIASLISGFPAPAEVWSELLVVLSDPFYDNGAGDQGIALQLANSLMRVFGGFALAIAVGIPVGLLIGMSKNARAPKG